MADPLSIVALGITVCQGYVAVLSAWRSFDKDLDSALQATEDLLGTLVVLKPLVDRSSLSASLEAVNLKDKIRGCETGVRSLEALLAQVKGQYLPENRSRKAWKKMQHLIHPLKKGGLNKLKENIGKSQHGLAVALQVYQLAIGSTDSASTSTKLTRIENGINDLPRTLQVSETSTLLSELCDSTAAISRDIENTLFQQTAHLATATEIESLQDSIRALPETLQIRENSSILSDIRDSTTTIPQVVENVVFQQTTSLATSTEINNLRNDVRSLPQSLRATENIAMLSNIHDTVTAIPQTTGDIVIRYLEGRLIERFDQKFNELAICHQAKTLEHMKSCTSTFPPPSLLGEILDQPISYGQYSAMSRTQRRVHTNRSSNLRKQYKWPQAKQADTQPPFRFRLLGLLIGLYTKASNGAGGLSIARMLSLRGFVCLDCKAVKVISDYSREDYDSCGTLFTSGKPYPKNAEQWCYVVKTVTEEVRRLLVTGEASPVSIDNKGDTLMHHSILWVSKIVDRETRAGNNWELIEICLDFIKALLDLGVPENEVNSDQISPLSAISWWSEKNSPFASNIQLQLREMGFDNVGCVSQFHFSEKTGEYWLLGRYPGRPTPVEMINIMRSNSNIVEATQCGPLSDAVLNRAGPEVRSILKRHPEAVTEINVIGQSPLHLSISWPEGVSFLLNHGANPNVMIDNHRIGLSVLSYACYSDCVESVKKLLDNGAYFRPLENLFHKLRYIRNQEIIDLLISNLVKRRNELATLAKKVLPFETLSRPLGENVLDARAYEVCREISGNGISLADNQPIEYFFVDEFGNALHRNLSIECLDKLWNLGFRDINDYDKFGKTPLIAHCYQSLYLEPSSRTLKTVCWLIDKGASLSKLHSTGFGTWLHYLSHSIANIYEYKLSVVETLTQDVWNDVEVLQTKFVPDTTIAVIDDCDCQCSTSGCNIYSMFIKFAFKLHYNDSVDDNIDDDNSDDGSSDDGKYPNFERVEELVGPNIKECFRSLIFLALGLKHTCCTWNNKVRIFCRQYDHEEIQEIHSEQEESYELLDRLIKLAEKKWSTETRPFNEFWLEFVREEIRDYEDKPIPGHAERLREIGVRLEGESIP